MAVAFLDTADRYKLGNSSAVGAIGIWASLPGVSDGTAETFQVVEPEFGARTGRRCWLLNNDLNATTANSPRFIFANGAQNIAQIAFAVYLPTLPHRSDKWAIELQSSAPAVIASIYFGADGVVRVRDSSNTTVAQTSVPVVSASEWFWLDARFNRSAGTVEIRDEAGNVIVNQSGLTFAADFAGGRFFNDFTTSDPTPIYYIDDIAFRDGSGTENNNFYPIGSGRVFVLNPVADDPPNEWPFIARRMFDNGVGEMLTGTNVGFSVPDSAALEVGSGDYTIEGTFRWNAIPVDGAEQNLLSKWRASGNQRSWRLFLYENGGDRFLSLEVTTDGTTGTLTVLHDFPFTPDLYRPYSIAVSRNSGDNALYIDGVRVGPVASDALTYYDGSASVAVGAEDNGTNLLQNPFRGWMDEIRYTVGVGRYAAEYTPATVKFPRSISDPSWNSVQLLMGFDNGNAIDESQFGRTVTANGTASALLTDDGLAAYQSIDKQLRDDTFIEAAYLPATGTLELSANPLNTQTVVVGATTYRFVTALSVANDVLIGVDADASIDNLIAAINQDPGAGTIYGTGTTANASAFAEPLPGAIAKIEALVPGTAGNSIVFTTTVTGATISGSGTLAGGENIPAFAQFVLERAPRGVTRVESVSIFARRSVFGPGGATMQPSFVDGSAAVSTGADTVAPANPAWQVDHFSTNGGDAWSIADLINSKIRVNRTS